MYIIASEDDHLCIWNLNDGYCILNLKNKFGFRLKSIVSLSVPHNNFILVSGFHANVKIIDISNSGKVTHDHKENFLNIISIS